MTFFISWTPFSSMRNLGIIVVCLILAMAAGCATTATHDEQFKQAWQNSENDMKAYGHQLKVAMGPEGSTDYDLTAVSEGSRAMIGTIDRHYDTIAQIPVSSKYAEAKREYLSALSDLRTASVELSQAQDAGGPAALGYLNASAPFLERSQQKRHSVAAMME